MSQILLVRECVGAFFKTDQPTNGLTDQLISSASYSGVMGWALNTRVKNLFVLCVFLFSSVSSVVRNFLVGGDNTNPENPCSSASNSGVSGWVLSKQNHSFSFFSLRFLCVLFFSVFSVVNSEVLGWA